MMDFDPNKPQKTEYNWATYFPYRRPAFQMHKQRSGALNGFQHSYEGILYKWNDDTNRWDEIYRMEKETRPENCEICHRKTAVTHIGYNDTPYTRNHGKYIWADKKTDSPRQVWCCENYACQQQVKVQYP
jgi:hypothetical protein